MFDRCCCRRTRQTIALELERLNEFVQWLLISDMGLCAGIWCKNTTLSKYPNRKIVKLHHNVDIGAVDIWCHQITNCCIQFVFCRCLLLTTCALYTHSHSLNRKECNNMNCIFACTVFVAVWKYQFHWGVSIRRIDSGSRFLAFYK